MVNSVLNTIYSGAWPVAGVDGEPGVGVVRRRRGGGAGHEPLSECAALST